MTASGLLAGLGGAGPIAVRVAVLAAHPDDETIGIGGQLARCRDAVIIHLTDGAPANLADARRHGFADAAGYARARRAEAERALALAGIGPERIVALGVPDQGAAFNLAGIVARLAGLLDRLRPHALVCHAYEGGHPDHDSAAFAAHAARARLAAPPALIEMAGYHADGDRLATERFLDRPGHPALILPLAGEALARKRAMLDCFATQRAVLAPFPLVQEAFRIAPDHDFTAPPHAGPLWYERFDWGVTGAQWRALAATALHQLPAPVVP